MSKEVKLIVNINRLHLYLAAAVPYNMPVAVPFLDLVGWLLLVVALGSEAYGLHAAPYRGEQPLPRREEPSCLESAGVVVVVVAAGVAGIRYFLVIERYVCISIM